MSGWRTAIRIAWREAKRSKARSAMVLAMIAVPVTGLAFAAASYDTFTLSPDEMAERVMGSGQAAITWPYQTAVEQRPDRMVPYTVGTPGKEAKPTTEQLLALLPRGSRAITEVAGEQAVHTAAGVGTVATLTLDYADPLATGIVRPVAGRTPTSPDEVALTPGALTRIGVDIGGTVTSTDGRTMHVVGTVEQPNDLEAATIVSTTAGPPGSTTWLVSTPEPMTWNQVKDLNKHGVAALSRYVLENPPAYADWYPDVQYSEDGPPNGVFALIAGLAVLEVVLLAGPAFAVGVRRRQRDLGLVSAAGGTPAHVRRIVLADGVVLGVLSAGVGAVLGIALAGLLRPVLESFLDSRSGAFRIYPVAQVVVFGVAVLTGLLAALVPAWISARQDVITALSGRRGIVRSKRRWVVVGSGLILVAAAITVVAATNNELTFVLVAMIVGEVGLVLCTPALVGLVARLGRWLPVAVRISLRNMSRNRTAAAPAISAVMAVVIATLAVGVVLNAESAQGSDRGLGVPGDVSLYSIGEGSARPPIPADALSELRSTMPVQEVHDIRLPSCPGGDCYVTVLTPPARACPYFHPGNPGKPSADDQRAALADRRCDDVGRSYGYFGGSAVGLRGSRSFASNDAVAFVVDDTSVGAVARVSPEDADQANAALRSGQIVVSDPRYVENGQVTLTVAPLGGKNGPTARGPERTVTGPAFVLPHRPNAPFALFTPDTATKLGLDAKPFTVLATTSRMPTADEQDRLQAMLGQDFEVRVNRGDQSTQQALTVLAIVAGVITLAAAALATGLAAADARADLTTLAAVGASPRLRRALSLSQSGTIAGLGSLLGAAAGLGMAVAVLTALNTASADQWPRPSLLPITMPWVNIVAALVVVPVVAMLGAGLLTRSRLPVERRG